MAASEFGRLPTGALVPLRRLPTMAYAKPRCARQLAQPLMESGAFPRRKGCAEPAGRSDRVAALGTPSDTPILTASCIAAKNGVRPISLREFSKVIPCDLREVGPCTER
jgi:hypothetical protein